MGQYDGIMTLHYHASPCFFHKQLKMRPTTYKLRDVNQLDGFTDLRWQDQVAYAEQLAAHVADLDAGVLPPPPPTDDDNDGDDADDGPPPYRASPDVPEKPYNKLKVAELKTELRARGLKVSGRKAELIARLADDDATMCPVPSYESSDEEPDPL